MGCINTEGQFVPTATRVEHFDGIYFLIMRTNFNSEKELEHYVMSANINQLSESGLIISKNRIRQFNLGKFGIVDILAWERWKDTLCIDVVELKKNRIDAKALGQGLKYVQGVQDYFRSRFDITGKTTRGNINVNVNLILIGSSVEEGNLARICNVFNNVNMFRYEKYNGMVKFKRPEIVWSEYKKFVL